MGSKGLEVWLRDTRCPRLQSGGNVELTIDMEHKVIPDHPMATKWVFVKLGPMMDKLLTVIKGVIAEVQVAIPGDLVTMLTVGIGICKTPIMRFELAGVQILC